MSVLPSGVPFTTLEGCYQYKLVYIFSPLQVVRRCTWGAALTVGTSRTGSHSSHPYPVSSEQSLVGSLLDAILHRGCDEQCKVPGFLGASIVFLYRSRCRPFLHALYLHAGHTLRDRGICVADAPLAQDLEWETLERSCHCPSCL